MEGKYLILAVLLLISHLEGSRKEGKNNADIWRIYCGSKKLDKIFVTKIAHLKERKYSSDNSVFKTNLY